MTSSVDDLLMTWYEWEVSYRPGLGYPRVSPTFRNTTPDDDEDAAYMRAMKAQSEIVAACVARLSTAHQAAVQVQLKVWRDGIDLRDDEVQYLGQSYEAATKALKSLLARDGII